MKEKSSIWKNILLIVVGVVCLLYGYNMVSADSSKWPTTTGQVASSDINVQGSSTDPSDRDYYVDVVYVYTVDGIEHKTTLHTNYVSQSDADKQQSEYAPGKELTVYYDPKDPGTSTLAPGDYKFNGYIGLITGIVLIGMGGWGMRSKSISSETPASEIQD